MIPRRCSRPGARGRRGSDRCQARIHFRLTHGFSPSCADLKPTTRIRHPRYAVVSGGLVARNDLPGQFLQRLDLGRLDIGCPPVLIQQFERRETADRLVCRQTDAQLGLRPPDQMELECLLGVLSQRRLIDQGIVFPRVVDRELEDRALQLLLRWQRRLRGPRSRSRRRPRPRPAQASGSSAAR